MITDCPATDDPDDPDADCEGSVGGGRSFAFIGGEGGAVPPAYTALKQPDGTGVTKPDGKSIFTHNTQ